MTKRPLTDTATTITLQTVLDRISSASELSDGRKRDLRSAAISFAKLTGRAPAAIPLDLAGIRETLDHLVPAAAKISTKRWANLRSDLAAAIAASGLRRMLKTSDVRVDGAWAELLASADQWARHGLSRFARWASTQGIRPKEVDDRTIDRFIADLDTATLVRNLRNLPGTVARAWNAAVVRLHAASGLHPVTVPTNSRESSGIPWLRLPASFRDDVERYLTWGSVPDPLVEGARPRALSPLSLRLQRTHVHSAATAALATGVPVDRLCALADLVEPETFRAVLRHRWRQDGKRLSAFTHGLGVTLIAIAKEWVRISPIAIAELKAIRGKLGTLPTGLTQKNQALLRRFERGVGWRLRDGRSSICRVPWRSISSSMCRRCGCRTYPRCVSTSICIGRRVVANRLSSPSVTTKPRIMFASSSKFRPCLPNVFGSTATRLPL